MARRACRWVPLPVTPPAVMAWLDSILGVTPEEERLPSGTPKPIVDKVNAVVNSALKDKEMIEVMRRAGMTGTGGTIEQMRSTLATDTVRWAAVVKASGAKVD